MEYIICPKAMSRNSLLGHIDHDTRQWTDGVISTTALEVSNQPPEVWSWVVCDGDIDPEWIEALNSVLDDNRLLTLPSGWRIQFGPNVNFIFETDSLEHASPATISRMGIILLSEDNNCAQETLHRWIKNAEFENETAKMAVPILQEAIKMGMHWFAAHRSDLIHKLYNISLVRQILTQFEYIAYNVSLCGGYSTPEELVYLAVQRSVTGLLKDNAVDAFHEEMSELLGPEARVAPSVDEWVSDVLYLSARLRACEPVLRAAAHADHAHLLLIGPHASAKNLLAEYILKESNSTVITIHCTPILEPEDIVEELKRNNVVRSGGRSVSGARLTLFVRALHRARTDSWGSCPVHSFLLQLMNEGGFWSRGSVSTEGGVQWWSTPRVRVLATATRANTASRFVAALRILAIPEPDDDELLELIKCYLKQSLDKTIPPEDISNIAGNVLSMYKEITETFYALPHYKWNAWHLKKWCENVKWYSPSNMADLITALHSEANMIFRDRLVTEDDKNNFYTISKSYLKGGNTESLYFVPKLRGDGVYMEGTDHRDWYHVTQKLINQCLSENENNEFGETGAEVCSELAVLWPAIARASNGGIVTCVGCAGVGRRAAAYIAAAALPATLLLVHHEQQFNTLLKAAISSAGECTRTLLVLGEAAASTHALAALEALRHSHAAPAHLMPTQRTPHTTENIKQNLGIVICLDKDQRNIWEILEKHPLLYNEGELVWLEGWSSETLRQMPQLIIQRLIKENVSESEEQHETIPVEGFVNIYNSVEASWARTPARYVNFVKTYYNVVCRKKAALVQRRNMLTAGVEALRRARSEVATLQAEASEQEALLSDKQAAANQALDQIGATVRATTDKREEMQLLKKNIEIENEKLQIRKKEIETELASVEPVIAAARSAVSEIRPESLSEIRSLRAPPDVVRDVLEGVLRLMGIADTSWHSMKNFLSKRGVKEDIRCMDASQISPEAAAAVQRLLQKRGASFQESAARRASAACAPLAAWVRANLAYADALARVHPLQLQQRELHKNLRDAEEQLTGLSSGLETVEERVSALKQQLGQHTRDAAALELKLQRVSDTLHAAQTLLQQLAHEYEAWEADLENISTEISELNQRSLLAAAYVVYLPDLTEPQAKEYVNKWSALIGFADNSFSVINFLSTIEKQLKWDAEGLPSDNTAVKNAVLIDQYLESGKCGFSPLIIDPDGDAMAWLRRTLPSTHCDFVSQHSDKLHTAVQYARRLGRTLVVTDVDGVHPTWAAMTSRLLLYARDAGVAAHLPPHYNARLSILHFTARLDGLTDQLVNYALQQQNPEMNEKFKEIKLEKATLQKQQHELQENLLRDLSSNSDILHDVNLLASLNATRATSATIESALAQACAAEDARADACATYASSARAGARLALAVRRLAAAKPLLALPADTVLDVFVDAVRRAHTAKGSTNIKDSEVVKYMTRRITERVLLSVHKKDKYMVVMHLLKEIYNDLIPDELWQLFLGSHGFIEDQSIVTEIKNNYPWVTDDCVIKLAQLKLLCGDLFTKLSLQNEELWKEFQTSGDLNALGRLKLSGFEVVAAVATLRPDSLYRAIVSFVDQVLGSGVTGASESVVRAARWGARVSAPPRPILLLAAHGLDVLAAHAPSLTKVCLEEGAAAWEAGVEAARGGGGWVALVVAASRFTDNLRHFLDQLANRPAEDFNPEFRLWIVCEDREIPSDISNSCVNVILEAPEGVKYNAMSTLSAWGAYEAEERVVRAHAALALLHAVLQERRAYIPQGWSRWYSWEWSEVTACARVIRTLGASATGAARAVCGSLYAARVTSAADRRILAALLHRCLGEHAFAHQWQPHGTDMRLPYTKRMQAYMSALDRLPDMDSPELLGLPANCRLAWEKTAATHIIAGLNEVECAASATRECEGPSPGKALPALWKKLMSGCPLVKPDFVPPEPAPEAGWWGAVCGDEAREAVAAVRRLHAALAGLARRRTTMHQVPEEWQSLWAGPEAPDAYLKEFCFRARAALQRLDAPTAANCMPQEVDARTFLRPGRVVSALRALAAPRLRCAPHTLAIAVRCSTDGDCGVGETCVRVTGLAVCGGEWCAGALRAAGPRAPPAAPAPALLLQMYVGGAPSGAVSVPVYGDAARENVLCVASAPLARDLPPDAALLHALALVIAPVH